MTSSPITYRSRRFPMAIDVTVSESDVRWCYRMLGDEWREQVPLRLLIPYPTTTISHSSIKLGGLSLIVASLFAAGVLYWGGVGPIAVATATLSIVAAMIACLAACQRGPIEWVSFDTLLPEKSIYFFRNRDDADFDTTVERMQEAIVAAQSACESNGDEADGRWL